MSEWVNVEGWCVGITRMLCCVVLCCVGIKMMLCCVVLCFIVLCVDLMYVYLDTWSFKSTEVKTSHSSASLCTSKGSKLNRIDAEKITGSNGSDGGDFGSGSFGVVVRMACR